MRLTFGHFTAAAAGLALVYFLEPIVDTAVVVRYKLTASAPSCTWPQSLRIPSETVRFREIERHTLRASSPQARDEALGLVQIQTPGRSFWVRAAGSAIDGANLIPYLLAEQQWIHEMRPAWHVLPGDVVVDVGAHAGVFSSYALARGAAKVVAVEPDSVNLECLRRNFAAEIQAGRFVIVPEGAWSSETDLSFDVGETNSGTGSLIFNTGKRKVQVHVRPIDDMLDRLGLTQVHFIKMDIEGAEREALRGAARTIARFRPRIMLDAYHLPDDPVTLPRVAREINSAYEVFWGPCSVCTVGESRKVITPHSVFFQ